jgi:EAL domain-containing protein (putative c-di-GMP-specific phosphodiesterase class I)
VGGGDLLDEPGYRDDSGSLDQWREYRRDVERVLALARRHLAMDVAWVSEFAGDEQIFRAVDDGGTGFGPRQGAGASLRDSYCLRVIDGRLPSAVPDARRHPVTRDLPGTREANIGSYVGVPIQHGDQFVGMLCCADPLPHRDLGQHEVSTLGMLAALLGDLLARSTSHTRERRALFDRISCAVAGQGLRIALQPIVATTSGALRGAEALARFVGGPGTPLGPSGWFSEAESVGLRAQLELTAAALALARLDELSGGARLTVNLSPDLVIAGALDELLPGFDLGRLVVEITEHAPIPDYDGLHRALDPHRAQGLQLAVDDAGAGYASFRHILNLRPDLIKVDISLVRDIDRDPAQQALVDSLVSFADRSGAVLLAEGVERQGELDELARLGVPLVQGFLLGRPTLAGLPTSYPRPTATRLARTRGPGPHAGTASRRR